MVFCGDAEDVCKLTIMAVFSGGPFPTSLLSRMSERRKINELGNFESN